MISAAFNGYIFNGNGFWCLKSRLGTIGQNHSEQNENQNIIYMAGKHSIYSRGINILSLHALMFLFFLTLSNTSFSQMTDGVSIKPPGECPQEDVGDFLRGDRPRKKPPRKSMILALPNVSYNPVNGLMIGVTGSTAFYIGNSETTRVSSIGFNAAYTTKKQFLFLAKSNIFSQDNTFFLQGDWRFLIYNAYTWGLGTNAPDSIVSDNIFVWQGAQVGDINDGFPMDYNYLKFHEVLNYEIADNHYAGLGYHLDHFYHIKDNALQLDQQPYQLTPHYLHSTLYGFDTAKYTLSGISLSYVYDSRDNQINPYRGYYVNLNYRGNPVFLGSSANSSTLWLEFRTYVRVSKTVPRHIVGFWFFSHLQVSGRQPYMTLMALGEDQKARSGRGYVAGRYRGENMIYGEVEYRFPITQCSKILGGVIFLNANTLSNDARNISVFDYVRPGVGFGLRLMINKYFRTNINLDFGWGYKSKGFYLSGTETF